MTRQAMGPAPPHCPNPNCPYHNKLSPHWPFKRKGVYRRRARPECIQRFQCLHCHRSFSTQSFQTTYYLKRPQLLPRIFAMVVGCMANRQIARALGCSPSTVALQVARLARHCLLFQARDLSRITVLGEVAIDGFETFEWSQYFPFHHNVAVDVDTGYFLFHTDSPLRRKGRMTEAQKARRAVLEAQLGRPDPKAVERGVRTLLISLPTTPHTIRCDDHRAYPRALRGRGASQRITVSTVRRDHRNPLWEINLLDLMIRHSTAAHKRETLAWAKRRQASIEKLLIFQVWRNYIKKRREKGGRMTSAMLMGLAAQPLSIRRLLRRRLFYARVPVPALWETYYHRAVRTPALGINRGHYLTYAF